MPFNAIVHAPRLRAGARLNIAESDQARDATPPSISSGAELRIRFGVCAPDLANGTIVDCSSGPDRAVLVVDGETWTLVRGAGGVTTPGLISEDWFVIDALPKR